MSFCTTAKNEDELGLMFLQQPENQYHDKIGYYYELYAGYSKEFRETSSSGGIATYIFKTLLENKLVDNLFIVKEVDGRYAYQFFLMLKKLLRYQKQDIPL